MENNTYFKINSVEELKEAYIHFQDRWYEGCYLKYEISNFISEPHYKNIGCKNNRIFLISDEHLPFINYKEVPNPLKEQCAAHLLKENKYQVEIKGVKADVYDVLKAFDITCPATQHAIKKLLKAGKRGYKDANQDLDEAIASLNRAKQLQND
jgi:hypothetical protein